MSHFQRSPDPEKPVKRPSNLDFFGDSSSTRTVAGEGGTGPSPPAPGSGAKPSTPSLEKKLEYVVTKRMDRAEELLVEFVDEATGIEDLKLVMNYAIGGPVRVWDEEARPGYPGVAQAIVDKLLSDRDTYGHAYGTFKDMLDRGIQENSGKVAEEFEDISATFARARDAATVEPAGRILSRL